MINRQDMNRNMRVWFLTGIPFKDKKNKPKAYDYSVAEALLVPVNQLTLAERDR